MVARDDAEAGWHAMYVSETGRRALIARFLTLGERSPYFTQVYPDPADVEAASTVRLHRVEYSATEFRDAWMFDLPAAP